MDLQELGDQSSRPPIRVDDGTSEGCSANPRDLSPAGKLGAHRSARSFHHNLEVLLRILLLPVAVGVTSTTIYIRLW